MTKNILKFTFLFALVSALCFGQTALSTTTLGAAITDRNTTSITLASTSTMQNAGPQNQINTCFYVDRELFGVITVVDSTHVITQGRGKGCAALGASGRPTTHASGAKVYFAITGINGVASTLIGSNDDDQAENLGSCTASAVLRLPLIYLKTGDIFDCKRTGAAGTSGQWVKVSHGTMAPEGQFIRASCTGTVGSAETDFLNGPACSGATAATTRYMVTAPGTLANFYAYSSAAFVGTGGSTFTVLVNGSNTAIVCAPTATATTCSDVIHSVAVVPGDVVTVKFLSATSDTAANLSVGIGLF